MASPLRARLADRWDARRGRRPWRVGLRILLAGLVVLALIYAVF